MIDIESEPGPRAGAGGPLLLAELACDGCGGPLQLDREFGVADCADPGCSAAGSATPLWRLLDQAVAAGRVNDRCPPGLPRPLHRGRVPIPWLTPVTAAGPHWRMVHRGRLAAAQLGWLCQVCGQPADPGRAEVIVDRDGWCLTSAPLHPGCTRLAAAYCPAITARGTVLTVALGDEQRHGELVDPVLGAVQAWQL